MTNTTSTLRPESEVWPIQLGLCCVNTVLKAQKPPIFCSRTMTQKRVLAEGLLPLYTKIMHNLQDVLLMMRWNYHHNIHVFRLSSDLFPHASNANIDELQFSMEFARDVLKDIGDKAKFYNQRLTFHPGQYNVIGTPNAKAFQQTVRDLTYHANVLDMMGCDKHCVMVVHFGGLYGNKQDAVARWVRQFMTLPLKVQQRLVIENCERSFHIEDCLALSDMVNVPVVFDTHHHECYRAAHPDELLLDGEHYIERILHTWQRRGIKPKFHVSEQGSGKLGHHSDYVDALPVYLLTAAARYNVKIDIMIEAKAKEQAIFELYRKYGKLLNVSAEQLYPAPLVKNKRKRELVE